MRYTVEAQLAVPVYDRQDAKQDSALVPLYAIGATRLIRRERTVEADAAAGGEQ